jgi:hypothetical protein
VAAPPPARGDAERRVFSPRASVPAVLCRYCGGSVSEIGAWQTETSPDELDDDRVQVVVCAGPLS